MSVMTVEVGITSPIVQVGISAPVIKVGIGVSGPVGRGVPAGGDQYDTLEKLSNADFDTVWVSRTRVLVLDPAEPVPADTPPKTVILRREP